MGEAASARKALGGTLRGTPSRPVGLRFSYDMLGEGARTEADAQRYLASYLNAIHAISNRKDKIFVPFNCTAVPKELAEGHQLFVMDPKGAPIRQQVFEGNPCFVLTDHIPMPKKTFHSLDRLGTKRIALGPRMLFASQCVVLIHNELDLRW